MSKKKNSWALVKEIERPAIIVGQKKVGPMMAAYSPTICIPILKNPPKNTQAIYQIYGDSGEIWLCTYFSGRWGRNETHSSGASRHNGVR